MEKIQNALKKNLGASLPFLEEIFDHMKNTNQNCTRSSVLLNCAKLFRNPDDMIIDIGTTLEFLHTASLLHQNINEFDGARRQKKMVDKMWGSEASVLIGDYLLSKSFKILTTLGNLDVLQCISLATKNISRGQVLGISTPTLTATPEHWYEVVKNKIAGLYGAGAESAAYWGKASKMTASKLFSFGKHLGITIHLKNDLKAINDQKLIQKKLVDQELWAPLCFLLHDFIYISENDEISTKLKNEFDSEEISEKLLYHFKKYEVEKKIQRFARKELKKAEKCLKQSEIDTEKLNHFTIYSNI